MNLREAQEQARLVVEFSVYELKAKAGGQALFSRSAGKNRNYPNDLLRAKDIVLSRLFVLADALGMTVSDLLDEALRQRAVCHDAWCQAARGKKVPKIVELALHHYPEADDDPAALAMPAALELLDELRFRNPASVLDRLAETLPSLKRQEIAYALGIAASCHRVLEEKDSAGRCAGLAESMAIACGNQRARGDALQRLVVLFSDLEYWAVALAKTEQALILFSELDDRRKMGEALIDRANCYLNLKDFQKALKVFSASEVFFDYLHEEYIFGLLNGAGWCYLGLRNLESADLYSQRAVQIAENKFSNPLLVGKSLWLRGSVAFRRQDVALAKQLLKRAAEIMREHYPVDSLVVKIDLAQKLVGSGQLVEARVLADSVTEYLPLFRHIGPVQDALLDLCAAARMAKQFEIEVLERAQASVENNRARFYRKLARSGQSTAGIEKELIECPEVR